MFTKRINWQQFFSSYWLLVGIIILVLALRLVGNTHTPPSPYWEEVALGYDAYSILQTGADHQGNAWPVVAFPSFGDFKPSGYFYALVPSIAVFGLNTFAVRLPAVLAGTLTTIFVYLWARDLAAPKSRAHIIALTSALLWAIQPWSWWLGRIGFEVNLATFLLTAGSYLLWKGANYQTQKHFRQFLIWTLPATLLLAASMYTYHGARLLAPLFAFAIVLWQWWSLPNKKRFVPTVLYRWLMIAGLAILLTAPILIASRSPVVQQRIAETSLFSDLTPIETSNTYRAFADNAWWSRIVFHRYVFWAQELAQHYMSHFSPDFLFAHGDTNPRHSSQYLGLLYPWEIITIGWGILAAWAATRSQAKFLFILLLLSPMAAMFTLATPHALRAYPLAVWLAILSGWGLVASYDWINQSLAPNLRKNFFLLLPSYGLVLLASPFVLGFYLWNIYPIHYANEWQYGYKEMIHTMRQHQQPGENLFVSRNYGRPSMYVLFYEKVDPRTIQETSASLPKDQRELLQFQEWTFFDGQKHENGLHAAPSDQLPENIEIVDTVSNPAGEPVWTLYR